MITIKEDTSQWETVPKFVKWLNDNDQLPYPFIVDIGAHDGYKLSNSYPFITELRWGGLLVEPNLNSIENIHKIYKDRDDVEIAPFAVSHYDGQLLIYINNDPTLSSSFKPTENAKYFPCITPKTLLDKYDITKVGILSVDTEGFDYPILESWMHNTKCRPEIIITESWPYLRDVNNDKLALLIQNNYIKILHIEENEIFYLKHEEKT